MPRPRVPDIVRNKALAHGAGAWLDGLAALVSDLERDWAISMREDPVELMTGDPRDRARRLASRTGRDAAAIWEWGVVERVSTGLLCTRVDLQPVGREMLATADRIAALETDARD